MLDYVVNTPLSDTNNNQIGKQYSTNLQEHNGHIFHHQHLSGNM